MIYKYGVFFCLISVFGLHADHEKTQWAKLKDVAQTVCENKTVNNSRYLLQGILCGIAGALLLSRKKASHLE
ncbi:MAG: hypothetical protein WA432_04110 [Candidatus Babeliaceae bacterium]